MVANTNRSPARPRQAQRAASRWSQLGAPPTRWSPCDGGWWEGRSERQWDPGILGALGGGSLPTQVGTSQHFLLGHPSATCHRLAGELGSWWGGELRWGAGETYGPWPLEASRSHAQAHQDLLPPPLPALSASYRRRHGVWTCVCECAPTHKHTWARTRCSSPRPVTGPRGGPTAAPKRPGHPCRRSHLSGLPAPGRL